MKAKKKRRVAKPSQLDFMRSIRKTMPPPTAVHGKNKYRREKKDFTKDAE